MHNNLNEAIYDWFYFILMYQKNPKDEIPLHDIFKYQIHLANMSGSCEPGDYEPFKYSLINLKKLNFIIEKDGKLYLSAFFDDWIPLTELMENDKELLKIKYAIYGKIQETIFENHEKHGITNYQGGAVDLTEDVYNKAWAAYAVRHGIDLED